MEIDYAKLFWTCFTAAVCADVFLVFSAGIMRAIANALNRSKAPLGKVQGRR